MTIKTSLITLVKDKALQTEDIPELQEFFGYLIAELNTSTDFELEEYYRNSILVSDVLRLVSWNSTPINVEFSESFIDVVIKSFTRR
ncbi:hypothetical protein ACPV5I_02745 [Vibrio gigantis]